MIKITATQEGITTEHEIFTTWADVPCGRYIDYVCEYEGKEINVRKPNIQRDLLFMFSNIPQEMKANFAASDVVSCFRNATLQLLNEPLPTGELHSFEFNGETYMAPTPKTLNVGIEIPMHSLTVEELMETMRLQDYVAHAKKGDIAAMPDILATLFRPIGESFDEDKAIERTKLFREQLPVTFALPTYFFLRGWFNSFTSNILIYMAKMEEAKMRETLPSQKSTTVTSKVFRSIRGWWSTRRTTSSKSKKP